MKFFLLLKFSVCVIVGLVNATPTHDNEEVLSPAEDGEEFPMVEPRAYGEFNDSMMELLERVDERYRGDDAKWPSVNIPYTIRRSKFDDDRLSTIMNAIRHIEKHTCIRFVARTNQDDYVRILRKYKDPSRCFASLGWQRNGESPVVLGDNCQTRANFQHEFLHALGFPHEQSRPDRDFYITINWDNIVPEFGDSSTDPWKIDNDYPETLLNLGFDMGSVMLYSSDRGGNNVITPKITRTHTIRNLGLYWGLTIMDVNKINAWYCPDSYKIKPPGKRIVGYKGANRKFCRNKCQKKQKCAYWIFKPNTRICLLYDNTTMEDLNADLKPKGE